MFENEFEKTETPSVKILGDKDPSLMSREEYDSSTELLFHGSANDFTLKRDYDYFSNEYLTNNDSSTTLGFGFYTVDRQDVAKIYSKQRQVWKSDNEHTVSILPYNARMLDFRNEKDPTKNIDVPKEFALEWKRYFDDYLSNRKEREGNIGLMLDNFENDYSKYLDRVLELEGFSLRVLLRTQASKELKTGSTPSPLWSNLFREFVIKQGYDGIIYNEKVEGNDQTCASYVFYNLEKIGTYDTWHNKE